MSKKGLKFTEVKISYEDYIENLELLESLQKENDDLKKYNDKLVGLFKRLESKRIVFKNSLDEFLESNCDIKIAYQPRLDGLSSLTIGLDK